jgi:hypothetical protein
LNHVGHEEKEDMTNPMKMDALLEGMELVETEDGLWFPVFAQLSEETPQGVFLLTGTTTYIPPALEPVHESGQGYGSREEAIAAYCAWVEAEGLPVYWRKLAAHTEVYPERNAWYLDEITQLTGDTTPLLLCGIEVHAIVIAVLDGIAQLIAAIGNTPDEAIETLYQRVYACHFKQETM